MKKKIFNWGQWDEINKALGIKTKKNSNNDDKDRKKAQIQKFSRCPVCGGQMTYVKDTNSLICDNEVEKEKIVTKRDRAGNVVDKTKVKVKESCGYVNLVDDTYMSYVNYLFN